jgi:cell division protein FtsB
MQPRKYNKIKRFLFSPVVLFLIAVLTSFVLYSAISLFIKRNDAWAKARNAKREEEELVVKNDMLDKKINSLETPEGVEAAIREKYHLAKEGENLIVITDSSDKPNQNTEKLSGWQRLKNKIRTIFK